MRNTALSTCTTNSRGVKSSLSRMTFHSGGRCVFGLVLLRGLTKVGLIMAVLAPGGGRRARPDHDSTHHPFRQAGCLAFAAPQRVQAPGPGAGEGDVQKHEAEQDRAVAAVADREETGRCVAEKVSERHLSRHDEGRGPREQAERE